MKKFIRTIFVLVLSLVSVALFACEEDKKPVFSAEDAIKVLLVEQDTYVSGDFTVPGKLHYKGTDYDLSWTSDNACLAVSETVNENGTFKITATRPEAGKQTATLTASLTVGETSATKSFSFNLYPIDVYEISDAYEFKYANKAIKESITLDTEFTYEGKTVQIKWTVDDASKDVLSIENNQVVFEEPTEEIPVKVWAEFEYNNEKALRPFNMTLIPATVGPSIVTEIADGDTFKFGFYQAEDGKYLYFTGEMNGYYGATTEDGAASTAVTVNVVEGGYQLSFINKEGNKQYITLVASGKYTNFKLVDEVPTTVWTWNAEYSTFVMDVVNTDQPEKSGLYFLGTYGSNKTFGASAISYITSDTNYIAHLYQLPYGPLANPVAGQPYKLGFYQAEDGKDLFLTGEMSGYYGATTDDVNAAVDVTAEVVEGGYHLTFMKDGSKKYITLVASGKYTNFKLVDEAPAEVWTWNAEYHTYVMDVVNTDQPEKSGVYFLGTYGSNKTFGASAISYASNSTNYIAHMYAPGASLPTSGNTDSGNTDSGNTDSGNTDSGNTGNTGTPATSLVEGQAYIVSAANATGPLYLKGTITSGRFDCSYSSSDAIKVYVEISEGNYYLYFMNAGVKTYINMDDKAAGGVHVTDKASATVYEWNATLNTLVVAEDTNNRAFGAGKTSTYTNFSSYDASQADYNWGQFIPVE